MTNICNYDKNVISLIHKDQKYEGRVYGNKISTDYNKEKGR